MKRIVVCRETVPEETRVALVPQDVRKLAGMGLEVTVVSGAGKKSGFADADYETAGARVVKDEPSALEGAEIVLRVMKPQSSAAAPSGALHVSYLDPFNEKDLVSALAEAGVKAISLEMIPRTTLAQKMDVQSSQTSLAGYVAVLNASARLPKILPMMVTPAGTIQPARVFVIGVGVAGLQAIATAKRLGARVDAFDTRPVVEEQVKSLGANFVKIDLGEMGQTDQGYAKELTPEQIALQREGQAKVCEKSDIVITTARVFGRKAPRLVTRDVLARMRPGAVVVDMAADSGGNVEGSDPKREVVTENGVVILPGAELARQVPQDASKMFSGNITALLSHCFDRESKEVVLDRGDEIIKGCLVTADGRIVHPRFA
ncbi:MAG: NAD(P) transhydrogenase subunit alpha [Kiritimatiellae bacterium]|nr:NAD(P) transhydrogenase subunit alpha [Kiritimatiellia bacterium]